MTLRVGQEEVVFTLLDTLGHTLDHDEKLYFTDETDIVAFDCVQEVLSLNPLDEYLGNWIMKNAKKMFPLPHLCNMCCTWRKTFH